MEHSTVTEEKTVVKAAPEAGFIEGLGLDRYMAILGLVTLGGLYLDGWAHNHGRADKTIFTPWHAILYSGFFMIATSLIVVLYINHSRGRSWQKALPEGYGLSLLAVPLFIVGGLGDLLWHTLFGFEANINASFSPTHLLLAFSGLLVMTGQLRAMWQRPDPTSKSGWGYLLPVVLSTLGILSLFSYYTQFAHPFAEPEMVTDSTFSTANAVRGVAAVLLQTGILMGIILFMLRRWRLPVGALTLIFTVNIALMSVLQDQFRLIPIALAAGITADLLYWRLKPSPDELINWRLFAFMIPVTYYLWYFIPLIILVGTAWSIHLWLGVIVESGILGLLLSYLQISPQRPPAVKRE